MKKIIINADDYGLSERFNQGIIELIEKGRIKSVTVMINRKYVFPQQLLKFSDLSIGLHLEEKKLENTRDYFENQIKKFKTVFKKMPSHLDGHKHCHLKKENRAETIKLALKYNLPVRSRFDIGRKDLISNKVKTPGRFISWHPERKDKFFDKIKTIDEKVTEIVCHPGYYDQHYKKPYNNQRESELKILSSSEFGEIISDFEIVGYKDFK